MAIRPEQLAAQLSKSLAPVYLIAGSEPLLVQECRDEVIRAAQQEGYLQRDLHEVAADFDWQALMESAATPSLFSSRRMVDLRMPRGKPGREGAAALVEMAENPDPDILLIVSCDQWGASSRKSKWAARLAAAGAMVQIWPVKSGELPRWIRERMHAAGLDPEPQAVELLAELVEGNLLAAKQEIEKLALLDNDKRVTMQDVERAVADSARFDAFRLVECALRGHAGECLRVASVLQRTGVAIQIVTGALYRELLIAESVRKPLQAGQNESSVFRRLGVWQARQGPLRAAIGRLSTDDFGEAFRALSLIDRQGKGRAQGDPWQTLDRLLYFLCEAHAARIA